MNKIKRILATLLTLALAITFIPSVSAEAAKKAAAKTVIVKTQAQLVEALKSGAKKITLKTNSKITVKIPKGDFYKVKLTINAPKATISNKGDFLSINVVDATSIKEFASGNDITISDSKLKVVVAASSIGANIKTVGSNANITLTVNGEPDKIEVAGSNSTLDIKGGSTWQPVPVTVTGESSNISTAINTEVTSEVATQIKSKTDDAIVTVENKSDEKVELVSASGEKKDIEAGEAAVVENGKVDAFVADKANKTDANGNKVNDKTTEKPAASEGGTAGGSSGGGSSAPTYNGGLVTGLKAFFLNNNWGTVSIENYTYNIPAWTEGEATSSDWHHDISSNDFSIKNGYKYKVSFTITSEDARTIKARVDQNSSVFENDPTNPANLNYTWHGNSGDVSLQAGVEKPVEFEFTSEHNDNYARLCFTTTPKEGTGAAKITIKNVKVENLGVVETPEAPVVEAKPLGEMLTGVWTQIATTSSTPSATSGVYKYEISGISGGNAFDIELKQGNVQLDKNAYYKISYAIKTSVARKIATKFQHDGSVDNNWGAAYNEKQDTICVGDYQTITYYYNYTSDTDANALFAIDLGKIDENLGAHTVEIKDVSVKKISKETYDTETASVVEVNLFNNPTYNTHKDAENNDVIDNWGYYGGAIGYQYQYTNDGKHVLVYYMNGTVATSPYDAAGYQKGISLQPGQYKISYTIKSFTGVYPSQVSYERYTRCVMKKSSANDAAELQGTPAVKSTLEGAQVTMTFNVTENLTDASFYLFLGQYLENGDAASAENIGENKKYNVEHRIELHDLKLVKIS